MSEENNSLLFTAVKAKDLPEVESLLQTEVLAKETMEFIDWVKFYMVINI